MNIPASDTSQRNRNRTMLLVIAGLFLGSFFMAGVLRFSGWRPHGMKNKGELLQPPGDLRGIQPQLLDGGAYAWNPIERQWRIAVAPPADCAQACMPLLQKLELVRELFGKDMNRVHLLWIGTPPQHPSMPMLKPLRSSDALLAQLPRVHEHGASPDAVPAYVIDPNGFVILRYAPGFDPGDLRTDLARLLKLR